MTSIFFLLIISAVIAYIGDVIGSWAGKRKLTIFNLRPRVTAILVAILTGIFITLVTISIMAYLSEHVRIALFSVEKITKELIFLEKEKERLQQDIQILQDRIKIKQQESIVLRKNEPIAAIIIPAKSPKDEALNILRSFINSVAYKAKKLGLIVKDTKILLNENEYIIASMAEIISNSKTDMVVGALAFQNVSAGEQLENVKFIMKENVLIFHKGQEIASIEIDGNLPRSNIAKILLEFMDEINFEVVKLGMIGNPLTGKFGDLTSESFISFYDIVTQIHKMKKKVVVTAVVKEDTYSIGPLNVFFKIEVDNEEYNNDKISQSN